jgi:hypothetical protein
MQPQDLSLFLAGAQPAGGRGLSEPSRSHGGKNYGDFEAE